MVKTAPSWSRRADNWLWIDHATVRDEDRHRFDGVERVTAWNVKFPPGFLARMPNLWWLDIRGGSAADLNMLEGLSKLRGLVVNQVRGVANADAISELKRLEFLELYGLARLESLPSLDRLKSLRRIQLGQLRTLTNWDALVSAPALEELFLMNKLHLDDRVIAGLAVHPSLRTFSWFAPDEPDWAVHAAVEGIGRPATPVVHSEDWLDS